MAQLTPEGTLPPAVAAREAGLDRTRLVDLYRWMVVIRRADAEALNLQRQGELGLWGQFLGQEAAQVGATLALQPDDWIFPSYREFGMGLVRGIDPAAMLHIFRGLTHGSWDPATYHFAPLAIPVASQVLHAVGYALGCKLDHSTQIVLACFGDGATSEGDWHEGMNFAGVFRCPVVFLCQNNHWAISVPLEKQTAGRIAERAAGYGFPGVRIDGNDVLTIYAVVRNAAERARRGEGPTLIEAVTYRMGAHSSADDPTRYRSDDELAAWSPRDPVARYEAWLRAEGLLDDGRAGAIRAEADAIAQTMRTNLVNTPVPAPVGILFDRVYTSPSRSFQAERDEFASTLEPSE
jgi:pyruvate dehydrogenase E1 component alpha subunit